MDSNKDTNKPDNSPDGSKYPSTIDYFNKDTFFVFLYKKTERLVSAVYMITDFLSDQEPVKWSVRNSTLRLLSLITEEPLSFEVKSLVLNIVSMLKIAHVSGSVSLMNYSLVEKEFNNLLLELEHSQERGISHNSVLLSENFFEQQQEISRTDNLQKGQITHEIKLHKGQDFKKKDLRSRTIIDIIKKKKEVTIKDISNLIKDCSEKTIQRELLLLVEQGVLKKLGERRWSRYSIN